MSLPSSRNTTYAALTEVKSADLNDLQDFIIQQRWENREKLLGFEGVVIANTTAKLCDGWRFSSAAANVTGQVQSGPVGDSGPFIGLTLGGTSVPGMVFLDHQGVGGDDGLLMADLDDSIFKFEIGISVPAGDFTAGTGDGDQIYVGLHSVPDGTAVPTAGVVEYCMLYTTAALDTNWRYGASTDGVETGADTGVAVAVGAASSEVRQMLRIEYYGVNTPLGVTNGFATVRFYIADVLIAEVADANVPTNADGSKLGPMVHYDDVAGVGGPIVAELGPIFLTHADHRY